MKKTIVWFIIVIIIVTGGLIFLKCWQKIKKENNIVYKTYKVKRGDVEATVTATGTIIPLTSVDVKSRAGGKVEILAVEEGDIIKKGQLIAQIDKTVSLNQFLQAKANWDTACARLEQAQKAYSLQVSQTSTQIEEAEEDLKLAQIRLTQAKEQYSQQLKLSEAEIKQAQYALKAAQERLKLLERGAREQEINQAEEAVNQAEANLENAKNSFERQNRLLEKGFTSPQQVENTKAQYEVALAQYNTAKEKLDLLKEGATIEEKEASKADVKRAEASLELAQANIRNNEIKYEELKAAKANVEKAKAKLSSAQMNRIQDEIKKREIDALSAQLAKAAAELDNARVNLNDATVIAPRDGVVLSKNVEEGTVITSGMSAISAGTTIVTLGDVTRMFVDAQVDEADIARVKVGQAVNITVDALPEKTFSGKVIKVAPRGVEDQNIVYFHVKIEILNPIPALRPGMTATSDIIIQKARDVLLVPSNAVKEKQDKSYVEVMEKKKPVKREVVIGIVGNEYSEVIKGLSEGEEIVIGSSAEKGEEMRLSSPPPPPGGGFRVRMR